jgi:hypothetical protein
MSSGLEYARDMTEFGKVDWWESGLRSRATFVCVLCVGLAFLLVILSPSGAVGLVVGLVVGALNMYFSIHPDSRFYSGGSTARRKGRESQPRWLYRVLFFAVGSFVIWNSVRDFLNHKG